MQKSHVFACCCVDGKQDEDLPIGPPYLRSGAINKPTTPNERVCYVNHNLECSPFAVRLWDVGGCMK